jgi:hypothetical protein
MGRNARKKGAAVTSKVEPTRTSARHRNKKETQTTDDQHVDDSQLNPPPAKEEDLESTTGLNNTTTEPKEDQHVDEVETKPSRSNKNYKPIESKRDESQNEAPLAMTRMRRRSMSHSCPAEMKEPTIDPVDVEKTEKGSKKRTNARQPATVQGRRDTGATNSKTTTGKSTRAQDEEDDDKKQAEALEEMKPGKKRARNAPRASRRSESDLLLQDETKQPTARKRNRAKSQPPVAENDDSGDEAPIKKRSRKSPPLDMAKEVNDTLATSEQREEDASATQPSTRGIARFKKSKGDAKVESTSLKDNLDQGQKVKSIDQESGNVKATTKQQSDDQEERLSADENFEQLRKLAAMALAMLAQGAVAKDESNDESNDSETDQAHATIAFDAAKETPAVPHADSVRSEDLDSQSIMNKAKARDDEMKHLASSSSPLNDGPVGKESDKHREELIAVDVKASTPKAAHTDDVLDSTKFDDTGDAADLIESTGLTRNADVDDTYAVDACEQGQDLASDGDRSRIKHALEDSASKGAFPEKDDKGSNKVATNNETGEMNNTIQPSDTHNSVVSKSVPTSKTAEEFEPEQQQASLESLPSNINKSVEDNCGANLSNQPNENTSAVPNVVETQIHAQAREAGSTPSESGRPDPGKDERHDETSTRLPELVNKSQLLTASCGEGTGSVIDDSRLPPTTPTPTTPTVENLDQEQTEPDVTSHKPGIDVKVITAISAQNAGDGSVLLVQSQTKPYDHVTSNTSSGDADTASVTAIAKAGQLHSQLISTDKAPVATLNECTDPLHSQLISTDNAPVPAPNECKLLTSEHERTVDLSIGDFNSKQQPMSEEVVTVEVSQLKDANLTLLNKEVVGLSFIENEELVKPNASLGKTEVATNYHTSSRSPMSNSVSVGAAPEAINLHVAGTDEPSQPTLDEKRENADTQDKEVRLDEAKSDAIDTLASIPVPKPVVEQKESPSAVSDKHEPSVMCVITAAPEDVVFQLSKQENSRSNKLTTSDVPTPAATVSRMPETEEPEATSKVSEDIIDKPFPTELVQSRANIGSGTLGSSSVVDTHSLVAPTAGAILPSNTNNVVESEAVALPLPIVGRKNLYIDPIPYPKLSRPILRPLIEVPPVKKRRQLSLDRVKLGIFVEGRKVHKSVRGYERLFGIYWAALSTRLEGGLTDAKDSSCRTFLDSFLISKKLKRLHNMLIMGKLYARIAFLGVYILN